MKVLVKTKRKMKQVPPRTISRGALVRGYRSGLEDKISEQITKAELKVFYETDKIQYTHPPRQSTYTPDFKLPKIGGFFYVETKGRFVTADRQKHLLIKQQHPEIDIRFVFSHMQTFAEQMDLSLPIAPYLRSGLRKATHLRWGCMVT
jgi:hypothetical protein